MTENKTQIDHIKAILTLSQENPDAILRFCVDGDAICDYGWTAHTIDRVEFCCWIEVNERIYTEEDSAKDEIGEMIYDKNTKNLSDADYDLLIDEYYNNHKIDAICVFTSAA
jgi:hypothetical protein